MSSRFISHGIRIAPLLLLGFVTVVPCRGQVLYDFGDPTAEEQQYLEYINRARANPLAEGVLLAATKDLAVLQAYNYAPSPPNTGWIVDLTMMQDEFNLLTSAPPLASNAKLMGTSRGHSAWMLANATQTHDEGSSNTYSSRITNAGYSSAFAGENISASTYSVWYGHAGFEVDWGQDGYGQMHGGMQGPPRGHRTNIHNANYREIGVGCLSGSNSGTNGWVGPQLVTQDFGAQTSSPSFGTGVAYYDLNANNFYDVGEEISGLTVNVSGASYYCTTASGGGWVIPVPTDAATRTVSFTGLNVNQDVDITFPASTNAKADLKLIYTPPVITSSALASIDALHTIDFDAVGGAASYKWNRWSAVAAAEENCDSTANITRSTTGTYPVLNTAVKQQGAAAFHLAIPDYKSQSFELNSLYYGNALATISFQSRIGYAITTEHFKVQVKEEGGTWIDVDDQTGLTGHEETGFSKRTTRTLTEMVGKAFRIRFLQQYNGGSIYGTANNMGWFIDAINFTNVSTLTNNALTTLTTNTGSFTPAAAGSFLMSVTPVISNRDYPAAYQTLTVPSGPPAPPSITSHPASTTIDSGSSTTLSVTATGTEPFTYQWYQGASGTITTPVGANSSSFTTPVLTATTSYWVRITNPLDLVGVDSTAATVTVNGITVSVAVSPAGVLENGTSNLIYTFTRTGPVTSSLTASFSVGGSATLRTDYTQIGASSYTASAGTVIFAAGSSTKTITIDPVAETVVESDETVVLTVLAGTSYAPGSSSVATGTIINDDASVSVAVSPASVSEDGSDNLVYTFTRTGASSGALTAKFSIRGTATKITDYTQSGAASFSTTGTVIFAPGATTATVTLDPVSDTKVEPNETAILTVMAGTGYLLGSPSSATGTITNDDATVSVAVSPASVTEDGAGNLVYTFTRSGATAGPLDVSFSVAGTALFETDYTQSGASSFSSTSGTVTFAPGATKAMVTLDPTPDTAAEANETAILTIVPGAGYASISSISAKATGTINNDDTNISVAISTASVMEDGINNLVYTFTRTGNSTATVTVNFSVGGTATFSSDYTQTGAASYTATTGTITLPARVTQKTVTLNPITDIIAETDETAVLTVVPGSGYTAVSPEVAIGTIANDDAPPP